MNILHFSDQGEDPYGHGQQAPASTGYPRGPYTMSGPHPGGHPGGGDNSSIQYRYVLSCNVLFHQSNR